MALSLIAARMTSGPKSKSGKVISEYGSKASPVNKIRRNGATDRYRRKGGEAPAKGSGRR